MSIIIFGMGEHLKKNLDNLQMENVIAFCDSDASKRGGRQFAERPIIAPNQIQNYDFDYVVVSSYLFFNEIASELLYKYGISSEQIVFLDYYLAQFAVNASDRKEYEDNCRFMAKKRYLESRLLSLKPYTIDYYNDFAINQMQDESTLVIHRNMDRISTDEILNVSGILTDYNTDKTVRFFVVFHKDTRFIRARDYCYISVGEPIACREGTFSDSTGDSIAKYNSLINECTALYWIWKNDNNEFVGLNHYRRFLESPMNRGWMIQKWEALQILKSCDVIVAERSYFGKKNIIDQLSEAVDAEAFNLSYECLLDIFLKRGLDEYCALKQFLQFNYFFPCQLFIMRRELLDDYCEWLFPILFEMIDRISINPQWDEYSKRIVGFWAERLLTVWLLLRKHKIAELPIILTEN